MGDIPLQRVSAGEEGRFTDYRKSSVTSHSSDTSSSFLMDDIDELDDGHQGKYGYFLEQPTPVLAGFKGKSRTTLCLCGIFGMLSTVWIVTLVIYLSRGYFASGKAVIGNNNAALSRRITFEHTQNGTFRAKEQHIDWTGAFGVDGMYLVREQQAIKVKNVNGSEFTLAQESDIRKANSTDQLTFSRYWISADTKYILLASDEHKRWRHSFYATYTIYNVQTRSSYPMTTDTNKQPILAIWSSVGSSLAFVQDNDIYMRRSPESEIVRLTTDGSADIFHGVPDWVFEEEVFASNVALWWSPDASKLAYLKTNDTAVPTFPILYFLGDGEGGDEPSPGKVNQYPHLTEMKYPKPGYPNPIVELYVYDIDLAKANQCDCEGDFADETRLITEVTWCGNEHLILRETNRESDIQKTVLLDAASGKGSVVREVDVQKLDGGWLEVSHDTLYVPQNISAGREFDGYIDVVISEGYNHLAYFSPVDSSIPTLLTSGPWEVVKGARSFDAAKGLVYFLATKKSPIERHLYAVNLHSKELTAITSDFDAGFYDALFSPHSTYYLLTSSGPSVPHQVIKSTMNDSFAVQVEANSQLSDAIGNFSLPTSVFYNISLNNVTLNVKELRPPNFDVSGNTKYPVLFNPYGGPISQSVSQTFQIDWHSWLASDPALEYIVVTVDGRGTGFMGRAFRAVIRSQVGRLEAQDQIQTARYDKLCYLSNLQTLA